MYTQIRTFKLTKISMFGAHLLSNRCILVIFGGVDKMKAASKLTLAVTNKHVITNYLKNIDRK